MVTALEAPAGTYNVVDDTPMTMADQARTIGAAVGARPWVMLPGRLTRVAAPSLAALARSQRVSNGKLRSLGWAPQYTSVREGVAAVLAAEAEAASPAAATT